jgi:hypothetical protein
MGEDRRTRGELHIRRAITVILAHDIAPLEALRVHHH